jgi:hypothetical protein
MQMFTLAKCLIVSDSSLGTIAGEIEKATPPMKITKKILCL